MNYLDVKELIEKHDSIVIYRHYHPDYDALGSQLGLYHLIKDNYPEKKVYTYGLETIDNPNFLEPMDNPSIEVIENSLTISLDTSTSVRSDDVSFLKGKEVLKIDHHLNSEVINGKMLVEDHSCATAYIISKLALSCNWNISSKAANYLYAGINSDTRGLTIESVDADVFYVVGKLVEKNVDIVRVNRAITDETIDKFKAGIYLGEKIEFVEDVAYLYVYKSDREKLNVSASQAKDYVDLMSNLRGVNKYAVFSEDDDDKFSVSLRSHGATVVDIAKKYGGGGHRLACGIKEVSFKESEEIIDLLIKAKE